MTKTREKDLKDASHSYQGAGNTEVRCRTCSDKNILARIGCFVKIFSQKIVQLIEHHKKRGKRDTFRLRCVSFLLFYKKIRLPIQSVKHKKLLSQYYFYIKKNVEAIFIIITDRYYRKIHINKYLCNAKEWIC